MQKGHISLEKLLEGKDSYEAALLTFSNPPALVVGKVVAETCFTTFLLPFCWSSCLPFVKRMHTGHPHIPHLESPIY